MHDQTDLVEVQTTHDTPISQFYIETAEMVLELVLSCIPAVEIRQRKGGVTDVATMPGGKVGGFPSACPLARIFSTGNPQTVK